MSLGGHLRDNVIFVVIAFLVISTPPAILRAETGAYHPLNFTQPLDVSRGKIMPTYPGARYLNKAEACKFMVEFSGWDKSQCKGFDALIINATQGLDNVIVGAPDSNGFVKFDDWDGDVKDEIDAIWDSLKTSLTAQGKQLGIKISATKWVVRPKLIKQNSLMYYAFLMQWDGSPVINIKASVFDRYGYVPVLMVPKSTAVGEREIESLITEMVRTYTPKKNESYAAFSTGDKIAAGGALGVLATLLGVKYGKGFFATALGFILIFAKKFWFLVFLPFLWIGKLFKRKNEKLD